MPEKKIYRTYSLSKAHANMLTAIAVEDRRTLSATLEIIIEKEHEKRKEGER